MTFGQAASGCAARPGPPGTLRPTVTRAEAEAEVAAIRAAARAAREPVAETARLQTPDGAPDALVVDRATWITVNADSMSAITKLAATPRKT